MAAERSAAGARGRILAACGLGWVLASRLALRVPGGSLQTWQRRLAWLAARVPAAPPCTIDEAAWAITVVAVRVPGTRCLGWALALHGLLAQAGVASELRIGVAAAGPRAIRAHAWIECAGRTLSWGDAAGYRVLWPRPTPS
jgi:hypothetical protein